jgi:hypothetical protein
LVDDTAQEQHIDETPTLLGVEKVLVAGRRWLQDKIVRPRDLGHRTAV